MSSLVVFGECSTACAHVIIRSHYEPGELTQLCENAIGDLRVKLDAIATLHPSDRNFDNTVLAYDSIHADFSDAVSPLTLMGYVSTNTEVQIEGQECEERVGQFSVEMATRSDIYMALKDQQPRNPQESRLFSETLKDFEKNGLSLSPEKLQAFKNLKSKLSTLETQFAANLNNDTTTIELTQKELDGVPIDYISDLKKNSDGTRFVVGTRESDSLAFMRNATDSEARRKWLLAYTNRQGTSNTPLLEEAILIRQQIAHLMGYSSWADYQIHGRMAVDSGTVLNFLNSLKEKLALRNQQDLNELLKFKKELDPNATQLNHWDLNYLSKKLKERDYSLDEDQLKEYFPADTVISGMFEIYSELFEVAFTEVKNAEVWSPDVKLYQIHDIRTHQRIGYFYADFFPRELKYGHAAAFPLISGRILQDGSYSHPVAAIVANLSPPSNGKPSLLLHDDVETLFHEFGHIMHQTLTRAPYASLSGSDVAQDFVEAPSQMLENWVWDEAVLNRISGHYLNPQEKLPKDLLSKMVKVRAFGEGYHYTRQLMLALLDMSYHTTQGPVDTTSTADQLFQDLIGVTSIPGGHFAATFGHLMGGYDAGYYGYLWSEVYAADLFTRFSSQGLLNSEVGSDYRRIILETGNMENPMELLRNYLGREPNSDAFFKKLSL